MPFLDIPPLDFKPEEPLWIRKALWFVRNPNLHIIPDKEKVAAPTWNPAGGFNTVASRFVSYRGKYVEGYLGWRPSGSFGISLRHANASDYNGPESKG